MKFLAIAPQLIVPDVVKAAEYYRDTFGFEIEGYFFEGPVFAIVSRDEAIIHFGRSDDGRAHPGTAARSEGLDMYVFVDDIRSLHAELVRRGAKIREGPVRREYGRTEVTVEDCFGFVIAFGQ